jgi:asparagine synthase (glutamine-hydrolysing)
MCGIAGVLGGTGDRAKLDRQLEAMRLALSHRGPDDSGTWRSSSGFVGLTHTRLSILDLSSAGHQPMADATGNFVICFNGEIYNFRELRSELEADGVVFRTGTDTEVLLQLYARHGTAMVNRLRGMFAFALWDEKSQRAMLARDRFGIKPLYYAVKQGALAFASELRALRSSGILDNEINPAALCRYFETGSVAEPETLLRGARSLEAGHVLLWENGKVTDTTYWNLSFHANEVSAVEAVAATRAALLDTVRAHFVSDVPVGLFLSGGIDSTALLALSHGLGVSNISTFSVGVDDEALDETTIAARTARHFAAQHHEMKLDAKQAQELFQAFVKTMDQPSIDGFNTFAVAAFARSHGMKVVLSGVGGDELFAGYPSFVQVPRIARASKWLHRVPGLAGFLGAALERSGRTPRSRRLGAALKTEPTVAAAWRSFRGIFSPLQARLLTSRYSSDAADCEENESRLPQATDPRDQISVLEIAGYMRNQLLKDSDVMSMAHGLELRVPLVDHVFFESVAAIPANIRLRQGKRLLIEAVPELPDWVVHQPKRGFRFPFEKWMSGEWSQQFEEVTRRVPGPNPSWYQRWCVFMLERWLERT